jgi:hypothetical protein
MYRHAADVVNSFITTMVPPWQFRLERALGIERLPTRWLMPSQSTLRLAPLLADRSYQAPGLVGFFTMAWLSKMEAALAFQEQGGFAATLRYEALRRDPGGTLEKLATALGLAGGLQAAALEKALGKDAQQGSSMASRQVRVLDQHDERRLRRLLAHHPRLNQPDVVLPGSLEP